MHQEFEDLKNDPDVRFAEKHMLNNLKRKECYQGCFVKWQKQRVANSWDAFAEVAPELAKQHSEIPNAFRKTLSISAKKWSGSRFGVDADLHVIPDPLAMAIESMLVDALTSGQEVGMNFIQKTTNYMIKLWNEHIKEIREHLEHVLQEQAHAGDPIESTDTVVLANGERFCKSSESDCRDKVMNMLRICDIAGTTDARRLLGLNIYIYCIYIYKLHCVQSYIYVMNINKCIMCLMLFALKDYLRFRKAAERLCKKLGLKGHTVSKQSKHLDYSHPAMEGVRRFVQQVTESNIIHPRLVANFDQVWSVHYEPPSRTYHKPEDQLGKMPSPCPKRSFRKIIGGLENYLGVALADREHQPEKGKDVCQTVRLNAAGGMNPVDCARNPRTCTTLSWRDGELGRSWITIAPGSM